MLIDDFSDPGRMSALGTFWRGFTDQVMGGVSTASSKIETIDGRRALRLTGSVSLENNGGFVQVALPLTGSGAPLDVSAYKGIRVRRPGEWRDISHSLEDDDHGLALAVLSRRVRRRTEVDDRRYPVRPLHARFDQGQARSLPSDADRRRRLRKSVPGGRRRLQARILQVIRSPLLAVALEAGGARSALQVEAVALDAVHGRIGQSGLVICPVLVDRVVGGVVRIGRRRFAAAAASTTARARAVSMIFGFIPVAFLVLILLNL